MSEKADTKSAGAQGELMCFVVMPISDHEGYIKGHFKHVYQDIIRPACQQAGFSPWRPDDVKQSNFIHLDILQKLLEAPMAVCDLSARNPNVLFELALRQAFDKPVALIQEVGTPQIFDISPLRYTEYRKERIYHEVIEDQKAIATAIKDTFESHGKGRDINSIVKLLALSRPAALPEIGSPEATADIQQLILSELSQLRNEMRTLRHDTRLSAQRIARKEITPDLKMIHEQLRRTEMLLCSDNEPIDSVEVALANCRNLLLPIIHGQTHDESMSNKEILSELHNHMLMLENEYHKRRKLSSKKK
jgi:hypothetical protein